MATDVLSALDGVTKKRRLDPSVQKIDELLALLEGWEGRSAGFGDDDEARAVEFSTLCLQLQEHDAKKVIAAHGKEVISAATKLSKVADKTIPSFEVAVPHCNFDPRLIAQAIHQHLLVSARFEAARVFRDEAGLDEERSLTGALQEVHAACRELDEGGTALVSAWMRTHAADLRERGAAIELEVMHLRFIQLLLRGETTAALRIIREYTAKLRRAEGGGGGSGSGNGYSSSGGGIIGGIAPGSPTRLAAEARVRQLVGAIAFARQPTDSPYAVLLDEAAQRRKLRELFTAECLLRLRLPASSALETLVEAGTIALPKLAKLASVLKDKYKRLCREGATLPLEIDLGPRFAWHSVFTCPISKEAGTPGNQPMLLQCGHVLGLASITKLARGSHSMRFKCPYCPEESSIAQAKALEL